MWIQRLAQPSARRATRSTVLALALALGLALLTALAASARPAHAAEETYDVPGDHWGGADDSLRIVINVPARELYLVEGQTLVRAYPVAVGRPQSPTPRGTFRILQKAKDPTWVPKGRPAVPPGPHNPLGPRWMRVSPAGYGIHATNEPGSIGQVRSHGCIRMSVADAIDLFDRVSVGTRVDIVYRLDGFDDDGRPVRWTDCYGLAQGEAASF
jgi:lipoprotein-anchoring transpeptidase ErfK/SrfK